MSREDVKRSFVVVTCSLLLFIMEGCAKKAMVNDQGMAAPEERMASPAETRDRSADVEYVGDQISPEVAKVEERELRETEMITRPIEAPAGLGDIFFDFDKNLIRPDARRLLDKNASWLKENPKMRIIIEGHADERGTNEYNLALGERRAMAAKRYLVALGIDSSRIRTISYGEEKPFCGESNEPCWQQNRRAHFLLSD